MCADMYVVMCLQRACVAQRVGMDLWGSLRVLRILPEGPKDPS